MKVSIKGVRGSIPTTDPKTLFYGGNTSCVTVEEDGGFLILDGGTGIQKVTISEGKTNRIDILLTHLHLDHIQGLGFFKHLFDPEMEVHIYAPASASLSLQKRLSRYLSPPLFPVLIRDLPCKLTLHEISDEVFSIGSFKISSQYIIHTGPTLGYRVEGKKGILAYLPDHEPALGPSGMIQDEKWISGFDLIKGADLLLHDAQYTAEEYKKKIGWGHCSMEDAIHLSGIGKVKKLLLTHHDPSRTDEELHEIYAKLQTEYSGIVDFEFAIEGTEIDLDEFKN
ncbi:MAG: MBL fold metallo-hydrolase [Cyclobacteriaceae bacterium]|nr:MBL fold metallo-hydrolase [Cyclobacteriaceae bacterium]